MNTMITLAGATYRQTELLALYRSTESKAFNVVLTLEPDNPYDPNAIMAIYPKTGTLLGYIPRAKQSLWRSSGSISNGDGVNDQNVVWGRITCFDILENGITRPLYIVKIWMVTYDVPGSGAALMASTMGT